MKRNGRDPKKSSRRKNVVSGMNANDRWLARHLSELVEKYAGKYVAISHAQVAAVGKTSLQVLERARMKFPDENPTLVHVPRPEVLKCHLLNLNILW